VERQVVRCRGESDNRRTLPLGFLKSFHAVLGNCFEQAKTLAEAGRSAAQVEKAKRYSTIALNTRTDFEWKECTA
jgi:hypothetical protein